MSALLSLSRLFLRTDPTGLRLAQCCPCLPSLLLDLLSPFLLTRRGGGRWAPHGWIGLSFMCPPVCVYAVCGYAIYTCQQTYLHCFRLAHTQGFWGFFFFFSVTSITGTGILYKRKKTKQKIDYCDLHDIHKRWYQSNVYPSVCGYNLQFS